ncbi:hypothetical protein BDN72DRAFT_447988 [Pluteus cervinus]|uniref:Uncharacterized protein n=1 Tax=Pluteus cervinus TaxID=181527 RepID=A0ACD3BCR0_9AGAR|nr:hypothetical protein BDN72DRAFT_447988 [Pluteus cervinus]
MSRKKVFVNTPFRPTSFMCTSRITSRQLLYVWPLEYLTVPAIVSGSISAHWIVTISGHSGMSTWVPCSYSLRINSSTPKCHYFWSFQSTQNRAKAYTSAWCSYVLLAFTSSNTTPRSIRTSKFDNSLRAQDLFSKIILLLFIIVSRDATSLDTMRFSTVPPECSRLLITGIYGICFLLLI